MTKMDNFLLELEALCQKYDTEEEFVEFYTQHGYGDDIELLVSVPGSKNYDNEDRQIFGRPFIEIKGGEAA